MFKRVMIALFFVFGLTSSVYAAGAESRVTFSSEREQGVVRHTLIELGDGVFKYIFDPNHCSDNGACTEMAPHVEEVELEVISDATPVDGPKVWRINDSMNLQHSAWTREYYFCGNADRPQCFKARMFVALR